MKGRRGAVILYTPTVPSYQQQRLLATLSLQLNFTLFALQLLHVY